MTAGGDTARRNTAGRSPAGRSGPDRVAAVRVAPRPSSAGRPTSARAASGRPADYRPAARPAPRAATGPDWPARVLLALMFLAVVAMLSLPQASAASASFGWMPLWLLGLPGTAWLALAGSRRHEARRDAAIAS